MRDVTERKQMEKALRDSEERYRALYEDNPSMYFTVDKHGKVLSVNKFGAEQLGYSVGELVGQSVLKVLYKEDRKAVKERLTECLQKPTELAKWEVRKVHKDGRLLWVREVARAVRDVDGNPIILIVCENITERKLTEQALQRSEERLSAIFNNTPNMAIESFDLNGRVLSWNKAAENIFGWTQQEALGKTLDELILNKDSTKEFHRIIKQINKTNKPYGPSEWEFSDKDGNKGIAYSTLFPISTGEGNKEFICMDVDITERKQAEEALRRSEERFRDLFDNAPDMYIILDPDSKIVDFNQRGLKQLGYKSNQVIGKSISNFIHPEDLEKVGMVMTHIQKTGEPPENIEVRLLQENGQALWVSKEVSLLKNDVGELQAILVVCRNITGHKRLQKELARAQRLETAGRVAGQIAHYFNNLLAPLTAYPTLMREELRKNHPILEMVDEIESAANKIAEINQQLLALGRRGHYSMESFDLNDLVQNLILSLNLPQELVVNLELDSNLLLIKGGIAQLTRALTNLIMNAKEAMQGSGVLTIKTSNVYLDERLRGYQTVKRGEYVKLEITDNGTGIASGILDKIFDPFFTTKKMDRMRGSGLGLSVVHGIIEDHKGYITVESSVGKGTTFSLYFPVSRDFERELADAIEKTRGGKEKILVVDDDPVQRRVAAQLLRYLGYKVHTVSSGEQAVKYVKKHPQDLLLLDMVMDGIDGTETYRQILNFKPDQKTIILSGYAMSQRVVEALRLGAGSFVSKPVTLNTLATTVRKELDRKRKKSVPGLRNDKS
ncbi:MAG: PAS domain S-box protein [bacterium]